MLSLFVSFLFFCCVSSEKNISELIFLKEGLFNPVFLTPERFLDIRLFRHNETYSPHTSLNFWVFSPLGNISTIVRKVWDGREKHFNPEEYDFKCNFSRVDNISDFFPEKFLNTNLTKLSGFVCKLHYTQFQMTRGTYSLRVAGAPRLIQKMKDEFDAEKAELRKQQEAAGVDVSSEEGDDDEEGDEADAPNLDPNADAKMRARRRRLRESFMFPVFIAPEVVEEQFVVSPFLLLPFSCISCVLVEYRLPCCCCLALLVLLRLIEVYVFGQAVPVTPNILLPLLTPAELFDKAESHFASIPSFLRLAVVPSLTRVEVALPLLLVLAAPLLPLLAQRRRQRGLEEEGAWHVGWMVLALLHLSFAPVQQLLSSLYAATLAESVGVAAVVAGAQLGLFAWHRQAQRRSPEAERELQKKKAEENRQKDMERMKKRLEEEREKMKKEAEEKAKRKAEGKEDEEEGEEGEKGKEKPSSEDTSIDGLAPPSLTIPEGMDTSAAVETLERRRQELIARLQALPGLETQAGGMGLLDFVQRFGTSDMMMQSLLEAEQKEKEEEKEKKRLEQSAKSKAVAKKAKAEPTGKKKKENKAHAPRTAKIKAV